MFPSTNPMKCESSPFFSCCFNHCNPHGHCRPLWAACCVAAAASAKRAQRAWRVRRCPRRNPFARGSVRENLQAMGWISLPIGSMYGIYANIGGILMVNVTIYSIHGSYGYDMIWVDMIWYLVTFSNDSSLWYFTIMQWIAGYKWLALAILLLWTSVPILHTTYLLHYFAKWGYRLTFVNSAFDCKGLKICKIGRGKGGNSFFSRFKSKLFLVNVAKTTLQIEGILCQNGLRRFAKALSRGNPFTILILSHGNFTKASLVGGLEHVFFDFPFSWECHHPSWRTHIFQRGRSTT